MLLDTQIVTPTQKRYADQRRERLERIKMAAVIEGSKVFHLAPEIMTIEPEPTTLPPLPNEVIKEAVEIIEREQLGIVRPPRVEEIQMAVSVHYGVSMSDIRSARRTAGVVLPRQVGMYLSKTLTLRSLPDIGRRFGGRDHTTVLHAVRKITWMVEADAALAATIEAIKTYILGPGAA